MTRAPDEKLAAALADVRRACRLLWAFQTRVLDYKRLIFHRLEFADLGSNSPLAPVGQTGNSVWARLELADMEYRGVRRHTDAEYQPGRGWQDFPKVNDTVLYIRIRADSGIPTPTFNDPNPAVFDPVESCQTKLLAFIVLNRIERQERSNLWDVTAACRDNSIEPGRTVELGGHPGYSVFGQEVNLAMLPDEEALVNWINGFRDATEIALDIAFSTLPRG